MIRLARKSKDPGVIPFSELSTYYVLGVVLRTVPPILERSESLMKNISSRVRKTDTEGNR